MLDEADALDCLHDAAEALARADVPDEIAQALMTANLTALQKPTGGIRGIATGVAFRRLISPSAPPSSAVQLSAVAVPADGCRPSSLRLRRVL